MANFQKFMQSHRGVTAMTLKQMEKNNSKRCQNRNIQTFFQFYSGVAHCSSRRSNRHPKMDNCLGTDARNTQSLSTLGKYTLNVIVDQNTKHNGPKKYHYKYTSLHVTLYTNRILKHNNRGQTSRFRSSWANTSQ